MYRKTPLHIMCTYRGAETMAAVWMPTTSSTNDHGIVQLVRTVISSKTTFAALTIHGNVNTTVYCIS